MIIRQNPVFWAILILFHWSHPLVENSIIAKLSQVPAKLDWDSLIITIPVTRKSYKTTIFWVLTSGKCVEKPDSTQISQLAY